MEASLDRLRSDLWSVSSFFSEALQGFSRCSRALTLRPLCNNLLRTHAIPTYYAAPMHHFRLIALVLSFFLVLALGQWSAQAGGGADPYDLQRYPSAAIVIAKILKVVKNGDINSGSPSELETTVMQRLYRGDRLPNMLCVTIECYFADPEDGRRSPRQVVKEGDSLILYLPDTNKPVMKSLEWMPASPQDRERVEMYISADKSGVPANVLQSQGYDKKMNARLDQLDYKSMCAQATDVLVGSFGAPDFTFTSDTRAYAIVLDEARRLQADGNDGQKLGHPAYVIHSAFPDQLSQRMIIFLRASNPCKQWSSSVKFPSQFNSNDRKKFDQLVFQYEPINKKLFMVPWTADREGRVKSALKDSKPNQSGALRKVNFAEVAEIAHYSRDDCFNLQILKKKRADEFLKLNETLLSYSERNLGANEVALRFLSNILGCYRDSGEKQLAAEVRSKIRARQQEIDQAFVPYGYPNPRNLPL